MGWRRSDGGDEIHMAWLQSAETPPATWIEVHPGWALLAESPAEFAKIKAVNVLAGLSLGGALMAVGW